MGQNHHQRFTQATYLGTEAFDLSPLEKYNPDVEDWRYAAHLEEVSVY
jgi:hypothetical protein